MGYLVYFVRNTASLMAVPFDADRLALKGEAVSVLEGVLVLGYTISPFPFLAISNSGTLIYVPGTTLTSASTLAWVDRKGVEQPIDAPPRAYSAARVSPTDGNRIALGINTEGVFDIWVYDIARGTLVPITREGSSGGPIWTPDGKHIAYERTPRSGHPAVMWVPADQSAPPSVLATSEKAAATTIANTPIAPASVSFDGRTLFGNFPLEGRLWTLPLGGSGNAGSANSETLRPLLDQSQDSKASPHISPDGHWMVYTSSESGHNEIIVTSYPDAGLKITISTDGGTAPFWSQNGRELFYRSTANKLMAVDVQTSPTFRAGRPKALFERSYSSYDITPDGQRFLVIKAPAPVAQPSGEQVIMVFNWFEELRRRVPLPK